MFNPLLVVCLAMLACSPKRGERPSSPKPWRLLRPTPTQAEDLSVAASNGDGGLGGTSLSSLSVKQKRRVVQELATALRSEWPKLQRCYDLSQVGPAKPLSSVSLRFTLLADGSVASTDPPEASGWPALAKCLYDVLDRVPLPEPATDVDVVYEMDLAPR